MNSSIIDKAIALRDYLSSSIQDVTVELAPEYSLARLSGRKVVVVPMSMEISQKTRGAKEKTYHLDIGILQRIKGEEPNDMIAFVEELGTGLLCKFIGGAICTDVSFDPIYSAEDIRSKNQFSSVISVTLREYT